MRHSFGLTCPLSVPQPKWQCIDVCGLGVKSSCVSTEVGPSGPFGPLLFKKHHFAQY